ncbi:hypothetical protein [Alicyclobacillus vulcanalis]|uniref:hypothetical protein n=1 Tax=Alicyclobacillus vulcanalis TaxID=252246 RepID=UPI001F4078E8|nr:hypothetical protein [Alicyclobacillus vulcanalis]
MISIVGVSAWGNIPLGQRTQASYDQMVENLRERIETSAEMSILLGAEKLPRYRKDRFTHYLLAPDSDEAVLAAKAIQQVSREMGKECYFKEDCDRIRGLDPKDSVSFIRSGLPSLLERIRRIVEEEFPTDPRDATVLLNVTSGFKAITPYTSAMAFLYHLPLVYKYEQSSSILVMHPLPVALDTSLVESHYETFVQLHRAAPLAEWEGREEYQTLRELGYVEEVDDLCALNGTGNLLLFAFERDAAVLDVTKQVLNEIQADARLRACVFKFARSAQLRDNKTENKNGHVVFDDGNNPYRIFYEEGVVPRVYAAHADHALAYARQLQRSKNSSHVYTRVRLVKTRDDIRVEAFSSEVHQMN